MISRVFLPTVFTAFACSGHAYIPVLLHADWMDPGSLAFGIGGGQQVGGTDQLGGHAILWHGSAKSAVILTPNGYSQSRADAAGGGKQVGIGYNPGLDQFHALLWSGSANDFVSLHPKSGFRDSYARGIAGNQQVGYVGTGGQGHHAGLWLGSAALFFDLHPQVAHTTPRC